MNVKSIVVAVAVVLGIFAAAIALAVGSGLYDVGADKEHSRLIDWLIETARERSISARTADVSVPDLADAQRIRRGAGNYDAMCAGCHLTPGAAQTGKIRSRQPHDAMGPAIGHYEWEAGI